MASTLEKRDSLGFSFPSVASFFPDLRSWSVGFEREWDMLEQMQDSLTRAMPAYPPYNIKKLDEGKYEIELAVAGYDKKDLEVEVSDNRIIVEGNKESHTKSKDVDYIYKGIASRHFRQSFALADHLEVKHTTFKDGILTISLEGEMPKNSKTHKITIE